MTAGSILTHFHGTPREAQRKVLEDVERWWDSTDVFLLRMPVGAGKSRVAHCIASWAGGGTICTPTNALLAQYQTTWPTMPSIPRGTPRGSAVARAVARAPIKLANYWSYLAHRMYSPVVVFDEAHRLVGALQDMEAVRVWPHLTAIPAWVTTTADFLAWAEASGDDRLTRKLNQPVDSYTVRTGIEEYRGHDRTVLELVPLTPRYNRPVLWPRRVRKLVLMSATLHYEDVYDLGLDGRRVRLLDCGSPIPPEDRPVVYWPTASMSASDQDRSLPALERRLRDLIDRKTGQRGVVHATYALAAKLKAGPLGSDPRLRWHTAATAAATYRRWLREPGDPVLVASGMTEGLDLVGDLARWQAVTKVLYPDLGDPAVAAKARLRPDWYQWMAARDLQQAVGRSSRGPGDYSEVYVLDSAFGMLYSRHREMFSTSFQAALHTAGREF